MDIQDAAWTRFVQTGNVSDYMQYCLLRGNDTARKASYSAKKKNRSKERTGDAENNAQA